MKRKYKKAALFSYLILSIAMFVYISMCIIGSYISLKYDIDHYYLSPFHESNEMSENQEGEYLVKMAEGNLRNSVVIYKIVDIYIIINILITVYGIFRLYNSKERKKE